MKGIIACFAIGCLALGSGAPANEDSKISTKSYSFENKEIIYSLSPFSNDELVYAVCDSGKNEDRKCTVTVDSIAETPDKETVQSCDLNLKYQSSGIDVRLFNAGSSKAVFAVKDGQTKIKIVSVNLKGCQVKEASVDVPLKLNKQAEQSINVVVVGHENNFDIIYENRDVCNDSLCKATIDYEGKVVKAPAVFPVDSQDYSVHQIEVTSDQGYLVGRQYPHHTNVYLLHDGDSKAQVLFTGTEGVTGVSTSENKLGYCAKVGEKLVCQQYDAEGKNKKFEVETTTGKDKVVSLHTYNLDKGLVAIIVKQEIADSQEVTVLRFDEQGKQVKSVEVDLKCGSRKILIPKLVKTSSGQHCVTSLCLPFADGAPNKNADFSRNTRCLETELF